MTTVLAITSGVITLSALLYAYLKGREAGGLVKDKQRLEAEKLSSEKAIYILSNLVGRERWASEIKRQINSASSADEFDLVYKKITTLVRTDSDSS